MSKHSSQTERPGAEIVNCVREAVPGTLLRVPLHRAEPVLMSPLSVRLPAYWAGGERLLSVPLNEPVQSSWLLVLKRILNDPLIDVPVLCHRGRHGHAETLAGSEVRVRVRADKRSGQVDGCPRKGEIQRRRNGQRHASCRVIVPSPLTRIVKPPPTSR